MNKFEVTLSRCVLDKLHIYNTLETLCDAIVVSQEKHAECEFLQQFSKEEVVYEYHFHLFLSLVDKYTIEELRPVIAINLGGGEAYEGSIHISALRSTRSWLKYITKEDPTPAFRGVDASEFHFSYKMAAYIRQNRDYNPTDSFIRQHPNYGRITSVAHARHWGDRDRSIMSENFKNMTLKYNLDVEWVNELWTFFFNLKNKKTDSRNKRHVLVSGHTGVGKSMVVKQLLSEFELWPGCVRLPCGTRPFEFSEIDTSTQVAYADDIGEDYLSVHRQQILQLLDGGYLSIDPKYSQVRSFDCKCIFVVCSNYNNLIENDSALRRRFLHIQARGDNGLIQTSEENIQEEAQVISSSEEFSEGLPEV